MKQKQLLRQQFRDSVFSRDSHQCAFCEETENLDAHHITDRSEMPNGGYVPENGISLCPKHHMMAELYHQTNGDQWHPGMHPGDLYDWIGSSYDDAWDASERLSNKR